VAYGSIEWPETIDAMAKVLRSGGLRIVKGQYAIRILDCEDFAFSEYGGDIGEPCIVAGAASPERLLRDVKLVSAALKRSAIGHSFEMYQSDRQLFAIIVDGEERSPSH
jgi:hypothetical protein